MSLKIHLLATSALLAAVTASAAEAQTRPASGTTIEELVVTAQKREEALQDVPIAVSAFNQDSLEKQKIEGGPNLVLAVPNVNFAKGNFTGYNFQIRGIGSKLTAGSGDAGIAVHLNNAPLISNNLFESEFYDLERVEVLRGPQGTLYGRNATGGVINLISAKPTDHFEAMGRAEYGNHNAIRARGMVNIPLGDMFAVRLAGTYLKRDGYGKNITTGNEADDRDLYGTRASISFTPSSSLKAYVVWDHFKEDDNRSRVGKQLCVKDPGPATLGGLGYSANSGVALIERGFFTQGCQATPVNSPNIFGTVNSQSTLGALYAALTGQQTGDAFAGKMQDPNPYNIESFFDPVYRAKSDIYEANVAWNPTDSLTLSWTGAYSVNDLYTQEDYFRYVPSVAMNATPNPINYFTSPAAVAGVGLPPATYAAIYATLFPGGVINDPQLGARNLFTTVDISGSHSRSYSHEVRLQSDFKGPLNFNVGALKMNYESSGDYYVMFNPSTAYNQLNNFLITAASGTPNPLCTTAPCLGIDQNQQPNRSGHNYYDNYQPYKLDSSAIFGEAYYQMTDTFKWTLGLRYTDDKKTVQNYAVTLSAPGFGLIPSTPASSSVEFKKVTGRLGFDWKPKLDFTDETLIYAFYSRGYKAGGLNPACSAAAGVICPKPTFAPEFVDAYEIGTKNTLLGGAMQLNVTGFYYNYTGYQISKIVNRNALNENIDAKIKGVEVESIWQPVAGLRLNANVGWLDTEIGGGESIDTFDRTQGAAGLILAKSSAASNCVTTLTSAQTALSIANATNDPYVLLGLCSAASTAGAGTLIPGTNAVSVGSNPFGGAISDGVPVQLKGKELPNSPHFTVSLGAQYTWDFGPNWAATLRGDYYWQDKSYARIYNSAADRLDSWQNVNATFTMANADKGWEFGAYVKNATDEHAIQDFYLTDDSSGLFRNAFYTEPRTYGVFVQKKW
ncbi:TonB-dependent receptor [Phenylobacterium soli]|uniref:TonB-dependent receptor n=1 Tax=Phenylobacterium soli TaxID=2170551 RepID=A0A328AS49_9CAUL|nr:TonB-dependent receptor [Phenylobacterium soli]RAK55758.1 TonB-dependent receptor [Phenylobacterium soli]